MVNSVSPSNGPSSAADWLSQANIYSHSAFNDFSQAQKAQNTGDPAAEGLYNQAYGEAHSSSYATANYIVQGQKEDHPNASGDEFNKYVLDAEANVLKQNPAKDAISQALNDDVTAYIDNYIHTGNF